MKVGVLALDYDGTIAERGALHPDVRAALGEARTRGIAVVLVTGRILADLRRVVGNLDIFDAVVAENGAVLSFPRNGNVHVRSAQPPPAFFQALARRGIEVTAGECVVEADAALARDVLDVIRELRLPLVILFNRDRMMVLPQTINKATGLHAALAILRRSPRHTLGIGDAENDHALLDACGRGVAVAWGSQALQAAADEVIQGEGPAAVAAYIRKIKDKFRDI